MMERARASPSAPWTLTRFPSTSRISWMERGRLLATARMRSSPSGPVTV
jgi:hypothetical protein